MFCERDALVKLKLLPCYGRTVVISLAMCCGTYLIRLSKIFA